MRTCHFWTSAAVGLAVFLLLAAPVAAQDPTPTPTPTPTPIPVDQDGMTTSPWYDEMVARVDDFFDGVLAWFDQAEDVIDDLEETASDLSALLVEGNMQIGDDTMTIDDLADEIADPVQSFFSYRCYVDSPLANWTLLFLAWMVLVMLTKFAISFIPYVIRLIDFIWNKAIDIWESIPFL